MEITPEQKAQLATWAGQRDSLLLEISNLQTAKDKLQTENKELADSNTTIITEMNVVKGRIEELRAKERELPLFISKEVASLESKKTCLETEIMNLSKLVNALTLQKESLEKDVVSTLYVFNTIKGESTLLDKVVDHVVRVSEGNVSTVNNMVSDLKKSLEEIVAVNKKNVFETNVVIEKLPKMFMEAQKHGLIKNKI